MIARFSCQPPFSIILSDSREYKLKEHNFEGYAYIVHLPRQSKRLEGDPLKHKLEINGRQVPIELAPFV